MGESTQEFSRASAIAADRIAGVVCETPLIRSSAFSEATEADVYLKLENRQHTGSFKLRGATNCLMSLSEKQRATGCVAASSGNHGAAVAYAMRELGMSGVIFVPEQTSTAKVDAIRSYGGEVRFFGTDGLDTEQEARAYAAEHSMYYVSPYNDAAVIAGQGTCGIEIAKQLPDVDAAFIAVGGGGLISGVGSVLKQHNPDLALSVASLRLPRLWRNRLPLANCWTCRAKQRYRTERPEASNQMPSRLRCAVNSLTSLCSSVRLR